MNTASQDSLRQHTEVRKINIIYKTQVINEGQNVRLSPIKQHTYKENNKEIVNGFIRGTSQISAVTQAPTQQQSDNLENRKIIPISRKISQNSKQEDKTRDNQLLNDFLIKESSSNISLRRSLRLDIKMDSEHSNNTNQSLLPLIDEQKKLAMRKSLSPIRQDKNNMIASSKQLHRSSEVVLKLLKRYNNINSAKVEDKLLLAMQIFLYLGKKSKVELLNDEIEEMVEQVTNHIFCMDRFQLYNSPFFQHLGSLDNNKEFILYSQTLQTFIQEQTKIDTEYEQILLEKQQQLRQLNEEIEKLSMNNKHLQSIKGIKECTIKELQYELQVLQKGKQENEQFLKEVLEKQRADYQELDCQFQQKTKEMQVQSLELKQVISNLNVERDLQLTNNSAIMTNIQSDLEKQIQNLKETVSHLQKSLADTTEKIHEKEKKLFYLEFDNKCKQTKLEEYQTLEKDLKSQISGLSTQLKELQKNTECMTPRPSIQSIKDALQIHEFIGITTQSKLDYITNYIQNQKEEQHSTLSNKHKLKKQTTLKLNSPFLTQKSNFHGESKNKVIIQRLSKLISEENSMEKSCESSEL